MQRLGHIPVIVLFVVVSASAGEPLDSASAYVSRGMQRFRENKIEASVRDFDRAAKLDAHRAPHLWQRGISLYYMNQFKQGRRQFEAHQAVNPHDVENAAWHFLCTARLRGLEIARKGLIAIDTTRDKRIPMAEVYRLYSGRGSVDAVISAAGKADTERARMYAHLYAGLYYEVADQVEKARDHLRKAAAAKLQNHYMHDVARIHVLRRKWDR